MEINGTVIEDTFSEAFTGRCVRATITARDMETVRRAALDATATPGAVIGRVEGGVESSWREETPRTADPGPRSSSTMPWMTWRSSRWNSPTG